MKVYILFEDTYECKEILDVFATEEAAVQRRKELFYNSPQYKHANADVLYVEEWEVRE